MDIKKLIGEATDYDKKLMLEEKKPKSWCKSVSAFANTFGGALIFGVSNEGAVVGVLKTQRVILKKSVSLSKQESDQYRPSNFDSKWLMKRNWLYLISLPERKHRIIMQQTV